MDDVLSDLNAMERVGGDLELLLNHEKCELNCPDHETRGESWCAAPYTEYVEVLK